MRIRGARKHLCFRGVGKLAIHLSIFYFRFFCENIRKQIVRALRSVSNRAYKQGYEQSFGRCLTLLSY